MLFNCLVALFLAASDLEALLVHQQQQVGHRHGGSGRRQAIMSGLQPNHPFVINTWGFSNATKKAWEILNINNGSALDAVEGGCTECEREQCDGTVGFGGSPDENGETTLDAMIMDGETHDVGSVGALRRIKPAISVARRVLENTYHTLLVGDQATEFAKMMGFKEESLTTKVSKDMWLKWKNSKCQPNFWKNVVPDPTSNCGPYAPAKGSYDEINNENRNTFGRYNHDTIGMIAIDKKGRIAGGTSTNGARHKVAGRVGDSPVAGAGAYVDKDLGGAAQTGDGDVMMRFLPTFQAVQLLGSGMKPSEAAAAAIRPIIKYYPKFSGALIVVTKDGDYGAACHGMEKFPYSIADAKTGQVVIKYAPCI